MNSDASQFVVFEYLYRDASNYKAWGQLLLKGAWTEDCQRKFDASVGDGLFVAEQIGIPVLYEDLYMHSRGRSTADDHAFHEFFGVRQATEEESRTMQRWGSVEQLLTLFSRTAGSWDLRLSPHAA